MTAYGDYLKTKILESFNIIIGNINKIFEYTILNVLNRNNRPVLFYQNENRKNIPLSQAYNRIYQQMVTINLTGPQLNTSLIDTTKAIGTTNRLELIEKALKNRPGRFDRVVEISVLDNDLRYKMFKNRLKDWKIKENTLRYLVKQTENWSGAETQEFVNTLNLDFINNKKKSKNITNELVDKIVTIMNDFGIGEKSSKFGFQEK